MAGCPRLRPSWQPSHREVGAIRIDVFTIFPDMVDDFAGRSLLGRARQSGRLDIRVHDLRSATSDPHRSVDDTPFGGGLGMVLRPEPVFTMVERVEPPRPLLLLGPGGRRLDQDFAAPAGRRGRLLAAVRALRGRRRAGAGAPRRRRALDRRLRPRRWGGGGHGRARSGRAAGAWAVMGNEASAGDESLRRRPARVPALHQAGRVPGVVGARDPPLGRSRAHRPLARAAQALGPRPLATRPDLGSPAAGRPRPSPTASGPLLESFGLVP